MQNQYTYMFAFFLKIKIIFKNYKSYFILLCLVNKLNIDSCKCVTKIQERSKIEIRLILHFTSTNTQLKIFTYILERAT